MKKPIRRINVDQVRLSIDNYLNEYAKFKLQLVEITTGKYAGRKAFIDGGIPDSIHGLLFSCYVLRAGCTCPLNSDGESRQLRNVSEFILLDEHYSPTCKGHK